MDAMKDMGVMIGQRHDAELIFMITSTVYGDQLRIYAALKAVMPKNDAA
jgi:hypothetical protein